MTKNEQIASILLEAAELLKNDTEVAVLSENIVAPSMYLNELLNEAVEYSDVTLLSEAADELSDFESEVKSIKDEKDITKIVKKAKSTVDKISKWYYKIEPDKKFGILRKVLKIFNNIFLFLLGFFAYYNRDIKNSKLIIGSELYNRQAMIKNFRLPDSEKLPLNDMKKVNAHCIIMTIITMAIVSVISYAVKSINIKNRYKYNIKDFDANINELQKGLEKINDAISKTSDKDVKKQLIKSRDNYNKAINELIKEKIIFDKLPKRTKEKLN